MKSGLNFNSAETSIPLLSRATQRLLLDSAADNSFKIQSWDVPGASPRAPADQNHRQTVKQPPLFDGRYMNPGQVRLLVSVIHGTPEAGR